MQQREGASMKPNFKNEMQVAAHEAAEPKAHETAQNSATELAREICASARKIAGNWDRYRFPAERLIREIGETAYRVACAAIYESEYEELFGRRYDSLVRDAKRKKTEATKLAKMQAKAAAERAERINAMFGINQEQLDDRAELAQ
jgi:hypothetical protein